jgi:Helix-turn-helix domain
VSLEVIVDVMAKSESSLGARLVMIALARYADEEGESCPSVDTIAQHAHLTRRGVQLALRRLEDDGEVAVNGISKWGTTIYAITLSQARGGEVHDKNVSSASPEVVSTAQVIEGEGQTTLGEAASRGGRNSFTPDEFEEWLEHYRETTGRPARGAAEARRLFAARRADYSLEDLKRATVGCHSDEWLRDKGHDVPTTILRASNVAKYIAVAENGGLGVEVMRRKYDTGDGRYVPQMSTDGGKTWETDYDAFEAAKQAKQAAEFEAKS